MKTNKEESTITHTYIENGITIQVCSPIAPRKGERTFPPIKGSIHNLGRKRVTLVNDNMRDN